MNCLVSQDGPAALASRRAVQREPERADEHPRGPSEPADVLQGRRDAEEESEPLDVVQPEALVSELPDAGERASRRDAQVEPDAPHLVPWDAMGVAQLEVLLPLECLVVDESELHRAARAVPDGLHSGLWERADVVPEFADVALAGLHSASLGCDVVAPEFGSSFVALDRSVERCRVAVGQ
jgi:hypothetical protein